MADATTTVQADLIATRGRTWIPVYDEPPIALSHGRGTRVWDENGASYLDLFAGYAVNLLGHAHPAVVAAVSEQVGRIGHVSNAFASAPVIGLGERLLRRFPHGDRGRVFFCTSGSEATEAAFKLTRRSGRGTIVVAEGSFHGRTMGALALTTDPPKQTPFMPLPGRVISVPFGDVGAMRDAIDGDTAAVFLEPVQGYGGVRTAPAGYLETVRALTAERGALLVLDEIQTGLGRTGTWFAFEPAGIEPDVVLLAKGLGGGLPLGACVAFGEAAELLRTGDHGSTLGGNVVSCAAGLAVLETIDRQGLVSHAAGVGDVLMRGIRDLGHPLIAEVRGRGLMVGVVLTRPCSRRIRSRLLDAGFLVNALHPTVIRLTPPLVLTEDEARAFCAALPPILDTAGAAA